MEKRCSPKFGQSSKVDILILMKEENLSPLKPPAGVRGRHPLLLLLSLLFQILRYDFRLTFAVISI
jgi:hypothetical protein